MQFYGKALYPVSSALKGLMEFYLESNPIEMLRQVLQGTGLWGCRLSAGDRAKILAQLNSGPIVHGTFHVAGMVVSGGSKFLGEYGKLRKAQKEAEKGEEIIGQIHHLFQNAAFRERIPREEGISINLKGNILTDIGSEHRVAHEAMEKFWEPYRKSQPLYGTFPTVREYLDAVDQSLYKAKLSRNEIGAARQAAIQQLRKYNIGMDEFVPRIPNRINFRRRK